jgi:DNA-binding LacI/PurR family transcriptional regulator
LKNEQRRLLGYKRALGQAGIAPDQALIWEGNLRVEDVAAMCRERLMLAGSRPEAVFCTNGPTALGVLRAFRDCGLRTPQDIGFVTFDELTVDDLFLPSITTIVQPAYEIGLRAAELLLKRIEGDTTDKEPITIVLQAILRVRESSQPQAPINAFGSSNGVVH